jgi:hypothetical protein
MDNNLSFLSDLDKRARASPFATHYAKATWVRKASGDYPHSRIKKEPCGLGEK